MAQVGNTSNRIGKDETAEIRESIWHKLIRGTREADGRCDMGYTDMRDDLLRKI